MKMYKFSLWLIVFFSLTALAQNPAWAGNFHVESGKLAVKTFTSVTMPGAGATIGDASLENAVSEWVTGEERKGTKIVKVESDIDTSRDGNFKLVLTKTIFIYYSAK